MKKKVGIKMNSEMYIKEMKETFKNANEWAKEEIKQHYISFQEGDIDEINDDFVSELKYCDTWEEAQDIVKNWII